MGERKKAFPIFTFSLEVELTESEKKSYIPICSSAKRKASKEGFSSRTKKLVYIALSVALTAALSQIAIPMPAGVPLTLQTFAVAFVAYFMGWKYALAAIFIYILTGVAGMPVFSNFTGGPGKLAGVSGGFIWGFFPFVFITGLMSSNSDKSGNISLKKGLSFRALQNVLLGFAGLIVCHFFGVLQFCLVSGADVLQGFITVSLPYIPKDAVSVLLAYLLASTVKNRLRGRGAC